MESRNFTSFDALGTPVFPNKFLDISQKSLPQSQLNQFWLEENRDFPFNWNNRVDFLQFTRQSQEFDFSLLTDEVSSLITTRNIEIVVFPQGDLSSEDFENQLKLDCQKHFQEKTIPLDISSMNVEEKKQMYKELCSKLVASMDYNLKAVKNQHLALEILHKRIGALSGNFLQRCKTCFNLPKEKRNIDLRLKEIESSINELAKFKVANVLCVDSMQTLMDAIYDDFIPHMRNLHYKALEKIEACIQRQLRLYNKNLTNLPNYETEKPSPSSISQWEIAFSNWKLSSMTDGNSESKYSSILKLNEEVTKQRINALNLFTRMHEYFVILRQERIDFGIKMSEYEINNLVPKFLLPELKCIQNLPCLYYQCVAEVKRRYEWKKFHYLPKIAYIKDSLNQYSNRENQKRKEFYKIIKEDDSLIALFPGLEDLVGNVLYTLPNFDLKIQEYGGQLALEEPDDVYYDPLTREITRKIQGVERSSSTGRDARDTRDGGRERRDSTHLKKSSTANNEKEIEKLKAEKDQIEETNKKIKQENALLLKDKEIKEELERQLAQLKAQFEAETNKHTAFQQQQEQKHFQGQQRQQEEQQRQQEEQQKQQKEQQRQQEELQRQLQEQQKQQEEQQKQQEEHRQQLEALLSKEKEKNNTLRDIIDHLKEEANASDSRANELEQKIKDMKESDLKMNHELNELKETISKKEAQAQEYLKLNEIVIKEREELASSNEQLKLKLDQLQSESQQLKQQLSADSSQNGSFRKQIEELSQQKAALKEENDHIIADREGLNSKIHSLEMEIANRQSTYELLYKEMENLRSQLEKVLIEKDVINKENRSLTASSIDLNSQSEQAKQQADIYSKENESLKIENESLKSENSNLNSTLNQQRESFQKEIAHTSQALNDFKEENIALKQSLEQLSAANNLIEEDINRLKEEKQSLISERDNYKDANQESLAKVTALTQKSIELQESLKSLTQENDNLKRDALQKKEDPGSSEFLVNENMALQSKIETLQAELGKLKDTESLKTENQTLKNILEEIYNENPKITVIQKHLLDENKNLAKTMEEIKNSRDKLKLEKAKLLVDKTGLAQKLSEESQKFSLLEKKFSLLEQTCFSLEEKLKVASLNFIHVKEFENVCYPVRVVVMTRPLLESELEKAKVHCENGFFGHKIVNTEREMIVFFDKELSDKLKKWFDNGREFVEFEALTLFDTEIGCCGEIKTKS